MKQVLGVVDAPISGVEGDALGLQPYAQALGRFILECDSPMTVGIQGDWGAGKTSLMNLIAAWLKDEPSRRATCSRPAPEMFTINTWQHAQVAKGDALALAVLHALFQAVAPKGTLTNLLKTVFGRWSKIEVAGIALEKSGEDEQADLTKLKAEITTAIQNVRRERGNSDRIVVFVDDLDRILPDRAVEILEALKNFVDVPGCVFVLACDYEVVKKGLKLKFDIDESDLGGRSFFDKIIQVPFRMPVHAYQADQYTKKMLDSIGWKVAEDGVGEYNDILNASVRFNPRSLKRLCNTLLLLRMVAEVGVETRELLKDPHHLALLFALVCMESRFEKLYSRVARSDEVGLIELLQGALDPEEVTDVESPLSVEEWRFLALVARLVAQNKVKSLTDEDVRPLQQMIRLSDISSVGEDRSRTGAAASVENLLKGMDQRTGGMVWPLVSHARRLAGHPEYPLVERRPSDKSNTVVYELRGPTEKGRVLGVTPTKRTDGSTLITVHGATFARLNAPSEWERVKRELEGPSHVGVGTKTGQISIRVRDAKHAEELVALLSSLKPFRPLDAG